MFFIILVQNIWTLHGTRNVLAGQEVQISLVKTL
jgi:hypothetical protein